ncbi:hypothetical protein FPRO05_08200 [Fusarium proliferatum]|uniref:Uncharacterized protein n=1 Tax=Gibberella intermedia TaxID=948311 RepID=A0A365NJ08_GIBIN|nr:hypothetical protein FPRO05_08200 [Fusarium proliferatum]
MASTEYSAPETTPVWLQKLFIEVFSIITPAGFEHMFRALGEPYTGLIWPDADPERATEKLNSGVVNAMTEFDVIPMQSTSSLSRSLGAVQKINFSAFRSRTFSITAQDLVLFSVEQLSVHTSPRLNLGTLTTWLPSKVLTSQVLFGGIRFPDVDHCFYVPDGILEVTVSDTDSLRMGPDEVAWLPAGTHLDIRSFSSYLKSLCIRSLADLSIYFMRLDDSLSPLDRKKLSQYESGFEFDLI